MRIYGGLHELIGNTPMIKMGNIYSKCEIFNPTGSIKDRSIFSMLEAYCQKGDTVSMASSGLSALSLAQIGASMGINVIIVATDNMDERFRKKLASYGAEVVLVPSEKGMKNAILTAKDIREAVYINHFEDPLCTLANRDYTGVEIWQDMNEEVDIFIAGVGTGASLTGAGELLRSKNRDVKIIAVEPEESAVLSGKKPGLHEIPGLGAGFIPPLFDVNLPNEILTVSSETAVKTSREMRRCYGLPFSISSGAVYAAAKTVTENSAGKKIVALLPA
ncbi:MAG: cysteine synthase family protein [Ruminococcus sp.]|jgi:cysteine synthase A|nr:cysteine synthase family protein [Ruminococcus sp.]